MRAVPRVRFAPSPTGNVHIGNIRAAIFNWLFARHEGGTFILRVEDTDLERSTQAAIDTLLAAMNWMGLSYDEPILYQTSQLPKHNEAVRTFMQNGDAYAGHDDGNGAPVYFRIPWDVNRFPCVRKVGSASLELHPDVPVKIDASGIAYAQMSRKGKPMEEKATLAGFRDLKLFDAAGNLVFELEGKLDKILAGETFTAEGIVKAEFTRHEVFYKDAVKGELAKPLDTIRDFIIVRGNGSPVFHIANVVDDITQNITHIIRGDDHVENTYRHLFLFYCFGVEPPVYAHLPMIVNREGKPYSKRDGDAFVGDFETKGFLPEALFNYLSLLGWSPGDGREKMTQSELIEAFSLERCSSSAAQLDLAKLLNMNGLYLTDMDGERFSNFMFTYAERLLGLTAAERPLFNEVAALMHSRTRCGAEVEVWHSFFRDDFALDDKALAKALAAPGIREGLAKIAEILPSSLEAEAVQTAIHAAESAVGLEPGKLNQPLRLTVTGLKGGADLAQTLKLIGHDRILKRIARVLEAGC